MNKNNNEVVYSLESSTYYKALEEALEIVGNKMMFDWFVLKEKDINRLKERKDKHGKLQ